MNNNICPECGTENEPHYPYCKNCGTALKTETQKKTVPETQPVIVEEFEDTPFTNTQTAPQNEPEFSAGYVDGIPQVEYRLFIGKNADKILPKFTKMDITGTNTSWCWPCAILGFFLGPLGAALWFFYRKMYKPAFILSAIGVVLSIVTGILTFDSSSAYISGIMDAFASGNFNDILSSAQSLQPDISNTVASLIEEISTLVTAALTGIFGYSIYKKFCFNKITEYKTHHADSTHYRLGLTYLGGTSGGMLALGIIIMLAADYIMTFITTMLSIFM